MHHSDGIAPPSARRQARTAAARPKARRARVRRERTAFPQDAAHCSGQTFAALRRTEEREYGEYRTRQLVLEAWDWIS
jgi:hypothetical protein